MLRRGTAGARPRPASILSPVVDLLCVGGLSLLVFVPLLLSGRTDLVLVGAGAQAWLATLINMPHFMASYRLVYRDRASIVRHKWASIYVPAILVVYVLAAIWEAQYSRVLMIVLISVSSAYLAWHYTGQVWGMMASFAYLDGRGFDKTERRLIRTGLRILLAWHVTWFLYTQLRDPSLVRPAYLLVSAGTVAAFGLGVAGLARMRRRTGRVPPARALVAWLALFVWYAVLARDPKALFWIQIAHALQYLAFPIRVEINHTTAHAARSPGRTARHMALYGVGLLAVSVVVAQVVPGAAMSVVGDVFGEEPGRAAPILLLTLINIHHYFTDGVIWKLSNPEVRRELFAHVPRPDGARRDGETARAGGPMRVAASLVVLVLAGTACASGPRTASSLPGAGEESRVTSGGEALRIRSNDVASETAVAFPVDQVWRVLPAVFDSLGIPVTVLEPARRVIGNPGFKAHRRLGAVSLSRYIDCGQAQNFPSADTYDVQLAIHTQLSAGEGGTATVATMLQAAARPMSIAGDYARCRSKGTLESAIATAVRGRLQPR